MSEITARSLAKAMLPQQIRRLLRGCLNYTHRVGRWSIILWQIRGATWSDQRMLYWSALAAPFLSFENLLEWQDPILLADVQVTVRGVGKFFVRARCDDLYHVLPWREHALVVALKKYLKKGDTFVDAGANIGFYTVQASRLVGESGKVIAVEMMPDTASMLRRNLALNQVNNVTVIEQALSDKAGQTISAHVIEGHYGQASIALGIHTATCEKGNVREALVKTATLSEVLNGIVYVAMMKMDLEGVEYEALQGAGKALSKIDVIVFEQWEAVEKEKSTSMYLHEAGFIISAIDGRNKIAVKKTMLVTQ